MTWAPPRWFTCPEMVIHPSTNPAVHSWESNSQPVDHKSDALSTKPSYENIKESQDNVFLTTISKLSHINKLVCYVAVSRTLETSLTKVQSLISGTLQTDLLTYFIQKYADCGVQSGLPLHALRNVVSLPVTMPLGIVNCCWSCSSKWWYINIETFNLLCLLSLIHYGIINYYFSNRKKYLHTKYPRQQMQFQTSHTCWARICLSMR